MKNTFLIMLVTACLVSCKQKIDSETLVKQTIEKYKNHNSISYDINYTIKFFDDDEPAKVYSSVLITRDKNDTVFEGNFLYRRQDSLLNLDISKYYKAEQLYFIKHDEAKITRINSENNQKSFLSGNIDGSVIQTYFLNINRFSEKLNQEDIQISYIDTLNFVKVNLKFADEGDYFGKEENIYIDKSSKNIEKITFKAQYKDQTQKNQWDLNNIRFDQVQDNDFEKVVKDYFDNYISEDYKPLTEEEYKLLDNGTFAPEIKGFLYPDYTDEIILKSNKILVIDFWYTTCMPCIKAIPHLNKLQENYKEYIEVVGVNPFEGKENQKEKIEAFLKRETMNYPILFTDHIVPNQYNVKVYPSLYIIGKDGKIKFSKIGSSEDLYQKLEEALKELI